MMARGLLFFCLGAAVASAGPVVETSSGVIEGIAVGDVGVWRGIPFARPPVGDLRWRPPQPADPWSGILDASEFRHSCMQNPDFYMGWPQPAETMSEDCLYLNVYGPLAKPDVTKPIMLWIFGGSFQGGGGNETRLNGTWDVALTGGELVVVTFNYRLGVFGFAASNKLRSRDPLGGTGNYGILDQRMAMQWTQANIASFGGDASRVFIVGQSAGAMSVATHLVRDASRGLFARAGLESGAGGVEQTVEDVEGDFAELLNLAGCKDVECLVAVPAETIKAAAFSPVVDGVDLTDISVRLASQGRLAPVPVLVGSVMEDLAYEQMNCEPSMCGEADFRSWAGSTYSLKEKQVDRLTDLYRNERVRPGGNFSTWYWASKHAGADQFGTCPSKRLARWVTFSGQDAFWYYWTYPPMGANGQYPALAHHACEQPFVFNVLTETPAQLAEDGGVYHIHPDEREFSASIVEYWRSFADSGMPQGELGWPKFGAWGGTMIIGDMDGSAGMMKFETSQEYALLRTEQCDFWDDYFSETVFPLDATVEMV